MIVLLIYLANFLLDYYQNFIKILLNHLEGESLQTAILSSEAINNLLITCANNKCDIKRIEKSIIDICEKIKNILEKDVLSDVEICIIKIIDTLYNSFYDGIKEYNDYFIDLLLKKLSNTKIRSTSYLFL